MMKPMRWLAAVLLIPVLSVAQAAGPVKYHALFQLGEDSVDRLMVALNGARSLQKRFGPENVEVEIVVFAAGVQTLKYYAPIPVADRVKEARYEGIRVLVDEESMRAAKLTASQMLQDIAFVESGVGEIVEKASQGWVVIRP